MEGHFDILPGPTIYPLDPSDPRLANPLNVEFGCGNRKTIAGWICHDREVDITKPLPYNDGSVDMIRAEHVCEHVSGPEFLRFLEECYRILKPGGKARISMPVICPDQYKPVAIADSAKIRDLILNHGHQAAYTPTLMFTYAHVAGFTKLGYSIPTLLSPSGRDHLDYHWEEIGADQDDLETFRMELTK